MAEAVRFTAGRDFDEGATIIDRGILRQLDRSRLPTLLLRFLVRSRSLIKRPARVQRAAPSLCDVARPIFAAPHRCGSANLVRPLGNTQALAAKGGCGYAPWHRLSSDDLDGGSVCLAPASMLCHPPRSQHAQTVLWSTRVQRPGQAKRFWNRAFSRALHFLIEMMWRSCLLYTSPS